MLLGDLLRALQTKIKALALVVFIYHFRNKIKATKNTIQILNSSERIFKLNPIRNIIDKTDNIEKTIVSLCFNK